MSETSLLLQRNGIALIPLQVTSGFIMSLFYTFIPLRIFDFFGFIASAFCRTLVAFSTITLSWIWGWFSDVAGSKKTILGISIGGQAFFTMAFTFSEFFNEGSWSLLFSF